MDEVVSQRLAILRKHLGERLGQELTFPVLSEMCGLKEFMIQRLEKGLKGNTLSLITLLIFYRDRGYNLDWILCTNNQDLPMMLLSGNDLVEINQEFLKLSQLLNSGYSRLEAKLSDLGYRSLDNKAAVESFAEPEGLAI